MSASSPRANTAAVPSATDASARDSHRLLELQQRIADTLTQMDQQAPRQNEGPPPAAPSWHADHLTPTAAAAAAAAAVSALPPAPRPAVAAQPHVDASSRSHSPPSVSDSRSAVSRRGCRRGGVAVERDAHSEGDDSSSSPSPVARERLWTYLSQLPLAGLIDQRDMDALLRRFRSADDAIAQIERRNLHRSRPAWAPPLQMEQLMALLGVEEVGGSSEEDEDDNNRYLHLPGAAERAAHSSDSAAAAAAAAASTSAATRTLPLPHASAAADFGARLPAAAVPAHSVSELDRQSARASLRECGIMKHATDGAECTDEQLHRMIVAAQGVSALQQLLVEMCGRSVQPQCSGELVFLVEAAARKLASGTHRSLAQQVALARADVERADRVAAGGSRSVELDDLDDEHAEPLPLAQLMDDNDHEPFPMEPAGFEQQMAVLRHRLERWIDRRNVTDWLRGPDLNPAQRRSVTAALLAADLLGPTGADAADIGAMDLDQLLPPVCSSLSTSCARLIAAVQTLGRNRVRARSFLQLVDMLRQHWAHAVPRLHLPKEAGKNTRNRDDRDAQLDDHSSCVCVVQ